MIVERLTLHSDQYLGERIEEPDRKNLNDVEAGNQKEKKSIPQPSVSNGHPS
jgi:hypothetical protein